LALGLSSSKFILFLLNCRYIGGWVTNPTSIHLSLHPHPIHIPLHHPVPSLGPRPTHCGVRFALTQLQDYWRLGHESHVGKACFTSPFTYFSPMPNPFPFLPPFPLSASASAYAHFLLGRATFLHTIDRPATSPLPLSQPMSSPSLPPNPRRKGRR
jgi:hypothetical protein